MYYIYHSHVIVEKEFVHQVRISLKSCVTFSETHRLYCQNINAVDVIPPIKLDFTEIFKRFIKKDTWIPQMMYSSTLQFQVIVGVGGGMGGVLRKGGSDK